MGAKRYSDAAIAEALAASDSVRAAATKLGMHPNPLEVRCRAGGLIGLYEACAARGTLHRGKSRRERTAPKRWAISWKPPTASAPIRIWSVEALDDADALRIVDVVMPAFIPRSEFSAAEEIAR